LKSRETLLKSALQTLEIESAAIQSLQNKVNESFIDIVELIYNAEGRVVITGIGKSANIANKIVSTLNSTGTPAIFMHAADAIHGDLGIIRKDDVVICISKSGNTPEIKVLVPLIKKGNNKLIAITGNLDSYLANNADHIIDTTVEREACPNNLAPTASTTAQLVMGDVLAVCLLEKRGFTSDDFAKYHPGGALGKRLYLKVSDLVSQNEKPQIGPEANIKDVILEISSKRLGMVAVIENEELLGIITDGDLRRMLESDKSPIKLKAIDIMTANPKTIESNTMAVEALELMKGNSITQLIVMDNNQYIGVVHMHDILKEGVI
jgi:arabinose-5-phosphate isomerase